MALSPTGFAPKGAWIFCIFCNALSWALGSKVEDATPLLYVLPATDWNSENISLPFGVCGIRRGGGMVNVLFFPGVDGVGPL